MGKIIIVAIVRITFIDCIWQIGDLYKKIIERGKAIHVQFTA